MDGSDNVAQLAAHPSFGERMVEPMVDPQAGKGRRTSRAVRPAVRRIDPIRRTQALAGRMSLSLVSHLGALLPALEYLDVRLAVYIAAF